MDLLAFIPLVIGIFQLLADVTGEKNSCTICRTDRQSCRRISGIFTLRTMSVGYNAVVDIPAGACSINITELGPSRNFLALKSSSGKWLINGAWNLMSPGTYLGLGTQFSYTRTDSYRSCPGECIHARGPTNESLIVQLLYYDVNPGIAYSFTLPPDISYSGPGELIPWIEEHHRRHSHHKHRSAQPRDSYTSQHSQHHTQTQGAAALQSSSRSESHRNGDSKMEKQPGYNNDAYHKDGDKFISFPYSQTFIRPQNTEQNSEPFSESQGSYTSYSGYDTNTNQYYQRGRPFGSDALESQPSYRTPSSSQDADQTDRGNQRVIQYAPRPQYVSPYGDRREPYVQQALTDHSYSLSVSGRYEDTYRTNPDRADGQHNYLHNVITVRQPERDPQNGGYSGTEIYIWKINGFTDCTQTCGGGVQETVIVCVLSQTQVVVTDENCDNNIKPRSQTVTCNTSPCPPNWEVGQWSHCSATCGRGTQTRRVECKRLISSTIHVSISANQCADTLKPAMVQQCQADPCAEWQTGKWAQCSTSCGIGQRERQISCINNSGDEVDNSLCKDPKPRLRESCDMGSCSYQWLHSQWTDQCSSDCRSGIRTRDVYCALESGEKLPGSYCNQDRRPDEEKACQSDVPCGGQWFTGPWGKCSEECGSGVRKRNVACLKVVEEVATIVTDSDCQANERPGEEENCDRDNCVEEQLWFMSEWSTCSVSCGGGNKTRQVLCLDENKQPATGCDQSKKPSRRQHCNQQECKENKSTLDPRCKDRYSNCQVVVQARLCWYKYYKQICCASCS